MRFNPTAAVLWGFTAGVGFLIGGTATAALTGLVVGLGLTLISDLLS